MALNMVMGARTAWNKKYGNRNHVLACRRKLLNKDDEEKKSVMSMEGVT